MMERGVHRARLRVIAPVGTALLLMCMFIPTSALLPDSEEPKCQNEYYPSNGICCKKCSAGYKLVKDCQNSTQEATCAPCPSSQYMDSMNHFPNCRRCKECKESLNEIPVSPCQSTKNTVCGCKNGFYKSFINSDTYQCLKCKSCQPEEKEIQPCTPERRAVCECKENTRRINGKCKPWKNSTTESKHLSTSSPIMTTKAPGPGEQNLINIIGGVMVVVVVVMSGGLIFITYKYITAKRPAKTDLSKSPSETSDDSQDSAEQGLIYREQPLNISVEAVPPSSLSEEESSSQIKTSDLIYTVLDLVPVLQVKQLSRSLGVRDSEIDHVELDYRSSREAHYQMLRVWAERESHMGMLRKSKLQELLDKLREMYLGRAAEELETKYGIQ